MYFTREEIKNELTNKYDEITNSYRDIDDALAEFADSFVPVYSNDIIKDWVQLPSEHSDRWKELGYDANRNEGGIIALMQMDMVLYYLEQTRNIWDEIEKEKEDDAN
jgi:hypothetical protein